MIHSPEARSAARTLPVVLEPLPAAAALRPIDAAERFRDLPGLALLESARPGRNARWSYLTADPVAVLEGPAPGADPFAEARRLVARLDARQLSSTAPPFLGGLVGYLSYDLGRRFERIPSIAADDQRLPPLRLALHDWVIAWDRATGDAWLGGRAIDGDVERLDVRLADVRARFADAASPSNPTDVTELVFESGLDRRAHRLGVGRIRGAIADGELYQANLTRRLEAPFSGDAWPLYRRLRTG
ncbi:MAG: hypothetical protein E6J17_03130, partial [Chloroflexi bacterium]